MTRIVTRSEAETESCGETFAATRQPGDIVYLEGPLGAGKTAFVRGMARGLGAPAGDVSSPTFSLLQEYRGRLTLFHADLYRLKPSEVEDLGLLDISAEGVLAVEWAERWTNAPKNASRVIIRKTDDETRTIEIAP